jgi:ethanolamine utilization protein EutN
MVCERPPAGRFAPAAVPSVRGTLTKGTAAFSGPTFDSVEPPAAAQCLPYEGGTAWERSDWQGSLTQPSISSEYMYLGKVIGRVVSTIKDPALEGRKLLLIRRLPNGPSIVAIDAVGAGAGETVYVCRGREAAFAFKPDEVPTEATVVAIVDTIERES